MLVGSIGIKADIVNLFVIGMSMLLSVFHQVLVELESFVASSANTMQFIGMGEVEVSLKTSLPQFLAAQVTGHQVRMNRINVFFQADENRKVCAKNNYG